MRYRILVRKLGFLLCVIESNPVSLTGRVMLALCDDADLLCLVQGVQGAGGVVWTNFHLSHPQRESWLNQGDEKGHS